ncbi:MAG: hypothetical protein ACTSRP_17550 [Candidatus Helarchaeota archaeon]
MNIYVAIIMYIPINKIKTQSLRSGLTSDVLYGLTDLLDLGASQKAR